jgi:hypothetical protein
VNIPGATGMSGGLIFGNPECGLGMKERSLKKFYAQSLELKAPWKVVEVKIDGEARQVRIGVECARGEVWGDPDPNERAEIKDWEERTSRHLDICQFENIITARLARITEGAADGVMRRALERGLRRRQLQPAPLLGFDEPERSGDRPPQAARKVSVANQKAIRKGCCYATILTDVENG